MTQTVRRCSESWGLKPIKTHKQTRRLKSILGLGSTHPATSTDYLHNLTLFITWLIPASQHALDSKSSPIYQVKMLFTTIIAAALVAIAMAQPDRVAPLTSAPATTTMVTSVTTPVALYGGSMTTTCSTSSSWCYYSYRQCYGTSSLYSK